MAPGPQTVVVAYDGSPASERALDRSLALVPDSGRVVVVTAVEVGGPGAEQIGQATPELRDEAEEILSRARRRAATLGRRVETVLGEGPPTAVILDAVRDVGPDPLVVGTRGAGPLERLLLGSVSSALVHHAPCDVLVVR